MTGLSQGGVELREPFKTCVIVIRTVQASPLPTALLKAVASNMTNPAGALTPAQLYAPVTHRFLA